MKTALVTGGNRGLGLETVKRLAQKGFKVYLGARSVEKGEDATQKLQDLGLNVSFIKLDVTKTADIRAVQSLFSESGESLDVLVNNAGVFLEDLHGEPSVASVLKVDPVIILKTIEANTMGPLTLIQSLVPLMMKNNQGRIINISSMMGSISDMEGFWPGYRMSKAALNVLTKITSQELEKTNISINSVCPGWCRTDMGGESATLSVEEGVETTLWLATTENPPTGKFLTGNQQEIAW